MDQYKARVVNTRCFASGLHAIGSRPASVYFAPDMPGSPRRPILVLLADSDAGLRESVRTLLHKEGGDTRVVGSAADGSEAVRLAARLRPDIAILDIGMPGMDRIRAASPGTRVILFTAEATRKIIRDAFSAGAHALVLKRSAAELPATVQRVMAGEYVLGSSALAAAFGPASEP
jgi:DNA-binding NarL/FixJ family response regulator